MQQENTISINYFEDPARFADLMNGYIYHGCERVRTEDIREINSSFARIPKSGKRRKRRGKDIQVVTADLVREVKHGLRVALIALENQTDIHYAMPVRVMNAESIHYHKQWRETAKHHRQVKDLKGAEFLSGFSREDRLIPTITIVVYFGKEPWDGPVSLKEMMDTGMYPPELEAMIADYRIHLLEVRKFEKLEVFHTDIQYVFGFLQNEGSKEALAAYVNAHEEAFENLSEDAYDMISVMAHSEELQNCKKESEERGGHNMCRAIKEMIEDGRQEGRREGRQEGRQEMLYLLVADGVIKVEEAARRMNMSAEEFMEKMTEAVTSK